MRAWPKARLWVRGRGSLRWGCAGQPLLHLLYDPLGRVQRQVVSGLRVHCQGAVPAAGNCQGAAAVHQLVALACEQQDARVGRRSGRAVAGRSDQLAQGVDGDTGCRVRAATQAPMTALLGSGALLVSRHTVRSMASAERGRSASRSSAA